MTDNKPMLSVIITSPTVERLKDITELLDSIQAQTYENIETIFVAELSQELYEQVDKYVKEKAGNNMQVIFNEGEPGLSAARNLGIKHARGDIICFIDDDAVAFAEWAEEMTKTYKDESIIGVTGSAFPLWEDESMKWFPKEFYWIFSCTGWLDPKEITDVRNAWGMNMSFRREAFENDRLFINEYGYHKGAMAEDNEFSMRLKAETGKRIVCNPNVKVWHRVYKHRLSWKFIKERCYWIGRSRHNLKNLYRDGNEGKNLLSPEHQLLRRIFTDLFPNIMKNSFRHPIIASRQCLVTIAVLSLVALGYYSHLIPGLPNHERALAPVRENRV